MYIFFIQNKKLLNLKNEDYECLKDEKSQYVA
jgi:hypothetical protein